MGEKFVRINIEDNIAIQRIDYTEKSSTLIKVGNKEVCFGDIKSFWHSRGTLTLGVPKLNQRQKGLESTFSFDLAIDQVKNEHGRIRDFLFRYLEQNVKALGSYFKRHNNKLDHIDIAQKLGLNPPRTGIFTLKPDLLNFVSKCPNGVITKVISDSETFELNKNSGMYLYTILTNTLTQSDLVNLPETFSPSLLQEKIEKKADIRVFYMVGKCSSMAIMSQLDSQTQIDFRRYNLFNPNRRIPFTLPS